MSNLPPSEKPLSVLSRALNQYTHQEKQEVLGNVLTLIDATVVQPQQNKALKDLIKQSFNRELGYWHGLNAMLAQWATKYKLDLDIDEFMADKVDRYDFSDRI